MSAPSKTEQDLRDALAPFPALKLEKCTPLAGGAYVVVTHTNGGRWLMSVKTATMHADAAARDIAARVARCMIDDAMELIRPSVNVISRGREA